MRGFVDSYHAVTIFFSNCWVSTTKPFKRSEARFLSAPAYQSGHDLVNHPFGSMVITQGLLLTAFHANSYARAKFSLSSFVMIFFLLIIKFLRQFGLALFLGLEFLPLSHLLEDLLVLGVVFETVRVDDGVVLSQHKLNVVPFIV